MSPPPLGLGPTPNPSDLSARQPPDTSPPGRRGYPREPRPPRDRSPASRSPSPMARRGGIPPSHLFASPPSPASGDEFSWRWRTRGPPSMVPPPRGSPCRGPFDGHHEPHPNQDRPPRTVPLALLLAPLGPRRGLSVFWVARVLCFRETPPIVPPAAPKLGGLSTARAPPATSWRHAGGLPGPDPGSNSPGEPPRGRCSSFVFVTRDGPGDVIEAPDGVSRDVSRHRASPRASWSAPSTGQACRSSTRSSSVTCPLDAGRRRRGVAGSPTRRRRVDASTSRASRASLP